MEVTTTKPVAGSGEPEATGGELPLEPVETCPICGSRDLATRGVTRTMHPRSELRTQLMECRQCLHWFITPTPSQETLTRLYRQGSEYVVTPGWNGFKSTLSIPERHIIRQETRAARGSCKYLEIGVGARLLFDHFKSIGYRCSGVEPGGWAAGWPDLVRDIRDLSDCDYDVVVMADVLEHVRDPLGMLQAIAQHMRSGTIYACFPNHQSFRARAATVNWRMVRPFGHLHFFSRQSLTLLFESSGCRVREQRKTDLVDFRLRPLLWPPGQCVGKLFMLFAQRLAGDQWIVQAEKGTRGDRVESPSRPLVTGHRCHTTTLF